MKFSSRKGIFFNILILTVISFLTVFSLLGMTLGWIERQEAWIIIPFSAISSLLLWIYFGTHYKLTDTELIYRSGPIKGKIKLDQIREIIKGKTLYAGLKPATAGKGLIIKYGNYDEIYISPESNERFVAEILKRNPKIKISE